MKFCSLSNEYANEIYKIEKDVFSDAYSLNTINELIHNNMYKHSLVMLEDKNIVAYIIATEVAGETEIQRIAVRSDCRRRGYASCIMEHFIDTLAINGADKILLEVRQSNKAAISLYQKFGFVKVGQRRGYYADNGEDAILYTLDIRR